MNHRFTICPLLETAGDVILSAGDVEHFGGVSEKGADAANLVTRYDSAVQEYLVRELTARYPDAAFMAEEQENDPAVLAAPRCFVIDPIDGTANFIHGYRRSAISLAMLEHGEITFAAVYDPFLSEMFTATRGGGAFVNGEEIHVSPRPPEHALTVFGTSPYYKEDSAVIPRIAGLVIVHLITSLSNHSWCCFALVDSERYPVPALGAASSADPPAAGENFPSGQSSPPGSCL